METVFDIAIIGAGPAGTAAALALKDSGLKVTLVDKSEFPRHKTCGDAIPGPTLKAFRQIVPGFDEELKTLELKQFIRHCRIIAPNGKAVEIDWQAEAYNSPREHFDNFLFSLVKKYTGTTLINGFEAINFTYKNNEWEIAGRENGATIKAKLLIGCDGANAMTTHHAAGRQLDRNRHCTAVAAYYTGVNIHPETNVFVLSKKYLPGYFWAFPVGSGLYNVGFGIMSAEAAKHKLKLREVMDEMIASETHIQSLFSGAERVSEVKGFGLPLGGKQIPISGAAYMLCGDAASMIDPLQGHGIDKAAYSGLFAGQQAIECFAKNNFSAGFIKNYDKRVYAKYGKELSRNFRLMKMFNNRSWVINLLAGAGSSGLVKRLAKKWF